jgi:hypothetical protein
MFVMMVCEGNIDDEYMVKYCDSHFSLLNQGGLILVNNHVFE